MKQYILEFCKRGLMAAAGGPVALAIIYGILGATGAVTSLTPGQVCVGVLTVTLMACVTAGISVLYQVERLPLLASSLIHAVVLYANYLVIYLVNGWLERSLGTVLIFTAIYAAGYALIWLGIYLTIRASSRRINRKLRGA